MPLPSNLNTITVSGTFLDSTGAPLTGTISFIPPPELVDPANAIMYAQAVTATLDISGHFSVTLICTDNSALLPVGWFYTVTELIKGSRSYPIYVPHTLGASVDLSSLVPVPSLSGSPAVIPSGVVAPGYSGLSLNNTFTGSNTFSGPVTFSGAVTLPTYTTTAASQGPVFNVTGYGAVGDGVHDDTTALQNAINAAQASATGGIVFLPAGTYQISGIPQISGTNITIRGEGPASIIRLASAALNAAGTTIGLWINGGTNITIENLAIDGNYSNIAKDGGVVLPSTLLGSSALAAAITTTPAAGTTETWLVNAAAAAATTNYASIPFVWNVDSETLVCTSGGGTTSWTVRRGFNNTTPATHANSAAITNTNGVLFNAVITTYGINSPKGYMPSTYAGGVDASTYLHQRMPIRVTNAENVRVRGCLLHNSISGGIIIDSTSVGGCTDVEVSGCRVEMTWDNGIYFHQGVAYSTAALNLISDTTYNGVSMVYCDHINVSGNVIRNAGPSFADSGGVQINGSSNCAVNNNLIDKCQFYGVDLLSTVETNITGGASGNQIWASNSSVIGNTITGCHAADYSTHTASGVNLFGSAGANIAGNTISNCDFGVSAGSKASNTQIVDNRITGCTSLGVNVGNSADVVNTIVKLNTVTYNGSHGIYVNAPARMEYNTVIGNNGMGINLSSPPSGVPAKVDWVIGNVLMDNTDSGVYANAGSGNVAVVERNFFGNSQAVLFTDGSITFGNTTFTSATANFTSSDVGLPIVFMDQGASGVTTATTISSVTNSTTAVVASAPQATETGVTFWLGRGPATYTDGSTTNAANSVLTSATASFTSSDAGKLIILLSQSPTPQILFVGTVQSVTNSTTAVLSGAAGALSACTLIINRSAGQQIRAINNGSGLCIDRNNTVWGIPELLSGGNTYNLQGSDRQAVYDASVTLDTTARTVAYVALTAARTATLPDATKYPPGIPLFIKDETGNASGTTPILLATQSSQKIDGQPTHAINTPYGEAVLYANAANWLTRQPVPVYGYASDTPADRGWAEWNFPILDPGANGTQTFVSGTVYGATFVARTNKTVSAVGYNASALAVTPTSGQNLIGLYSVSGTTWTQIAITGDLTTWGSTNNAVFANFGGSVTLQPGATYALLLMSNATTPVILRGVSGSSMSWLNAGMGNTASPWMRFFVYGTSQTALPASFTAGAGTMSATGALAPWVALK